MFADKSQKSQRFGKSAVAGGLRLSEYILTNVNKQERFAFFVAQDKESASAALAET